MNLSFKMTQYLVKILIFVNLPTINVCKIGSKGYTSLPKAVKAAKKGQTITITKTIEVSKTVTINKNITINFNNKRYAYNGNGSAFVISKGKAVFKKGKCSVDYTNFASVQKGASLTIESGTYQGTGKYTDQRPCLLGNDGTVVIKNGTFTTTDMFVIRNAGKMTIKNAKITSKESNKEPDNSNYPAIYNMGGTLSFRKAKVTSVDDAVYNCNKGKCTINNGTFLSTDRVTIDNVGASTETIIKNGNFGKKGVSWYSAVRNEDGIVKISGGNIFLAESRGFGSLVFEFSGGTINSCDDAEDEGGWAFHIMNNSKFLMSGGLITGDCRCLVYLNQPDCSMKMTGGEIINTKRNADFAIGLSTGQAKTELISGKISALWPYTSQSASMSNVTISDQFVIDKVA